MKALLAIALVAAFALPASAGASQRDVENAWPAWGFPVKHDLQTYVRAFAILGGSDAEGYARASVKLKRAVDLRGRTVNLLRRERYVDDDTASEFCEVSSRRVTYWMICGDLGSGTGYGQR